MRRTDHRESRRGQGQSRGRLKGATRRKAKPPLALGSPDAKPGVRSGGVASGKRDPMRCAPLRETYGRLSGAEPEEAGTPETVTRKPRRKRSGGGTRAAK
jgi:hypothetical protein